MIIVNLKAKRKSICERLNNIDSNSFISIEDTIAISKKVYEKIDTLISQEEIEKDVEDNLAKVARLKERVEKIFNDKAVLVHFKDRECGAVKINVKDFFEHLDDIAKFKEGYRDLIFVDEELRYGICIERYEYFNRLVIWD